MTMTQIDLKALEAGLQYVRDLFTDMQDEGLDRDDSSRHYEVVHDAARAYLASQAAPTDKICEVCKVSGAPPDAGNDAYRNLDCDLCNPKVEVQASEAKTAATLEALEFINDKDLAYVNPSGKFSFIPDRIQQTIHRTLTSSKNALQRPSVNDDDQQFIRDMANVEDMMQLTVTARTSRMLSHETIVSWLAVFRKLKERLDK